ncbi:transcriptional regulator with XRE-family HTH domain [Evansella vedderi]|uniref:Transcriptional regulator with XRE-family HTH domain n=1 Tax=Evansella vedderi TaxID=38282 RepID=A0ABU0A370_9BACI|nr:helix-turn-helix transcriptional regulator [Evansella vedderi]MDQ0257943.1 transcriptional regulator with XRE-family HTH domain [Evansella vedderi]
MTNRIRDIDFLKEELKSKGISQTKLAKEMNCSQPYVNQVLNGLKDPRNSFCIKICRLLDKDFDELFVEYDKYGYIAEIDPDFPFDFFPDVAKEIGLNESIIIQYLLGWEYNYKSVQQNFMDGYYWVIIKPGQWEEIFCFWDKLTVKKLVENLISRGLLVQKENWFRVHRDNYIKECS